MQELDLNRVYSEIDAGSQRLENTRAPTWDGGIPATEKTILQRFKVHFVPANQMSGYLAYIYELVKAPHNISATFRYRQVKYFNKKNDLTPNLEMTVRN